MTNSSRFAMSALPRRVRRALARQEARQQRRWRRARQRALAAGLSVTVAAALGVVAAPPASAATFDVTNTNDSGPGSLRLAINQANASGGSDDINFQPGLSGTITLASPLPTISDSTTINGPTTSVVTVDGVGTHRPFTIDSTGVIAVNINHLTLANGGDGSFNGGAVFSRRTNLTLANMTINGSKAVHGGGVYFDGLDTTSLTINNSTISGNTASGKGGGVSVGDNASFLSPANFTVSGSTISNNTATVSGGGIDVFSQGNFASVNVTSSTVSGNHSAGPGSGINVEGNAPSSNNNGLVIQDSTISGNSQSSGGTRGGGLQLNQIWATIRRSTFSGNTADKGGGISVLDANMKFINSTISGNTAAAGVGGGIYQKSSGTLDLEFVTVASNTASTNGGGISVTSGTNTIITESIFGDNTGTTGNEDDIDSATAGGAVTASYSLIEAPGTSVIGGGGNNRPVGTDPALEPLAVDPSAPNAPATHRLKAASTARDNGDPTSFVNEDQRQKFRPRNGVVDIGAVEFQTAVPATPGAPDLDAASDTGSSNADDRTNDKTPTFTYTGADAGSTVTLFRDGVALPGPVTAVAPNAITDTTGTVTDGVHTYSITQTSSDGVASSEGPTVSVTIDTAAPAAPTTLDLQAGSDSGTSNTDNYTNAANPVFDITGEASATFTLLRGATTVGSANVASPITDTGAPAGNQSYTATQTDLAGNVSPATSALAVTIDRTALAPTAPDLQAGSDTGASNTDNTTNAANPVFDITGEASATFTLLRGGATVGTANVASPITDTGAPAGNQSYTATQRDLAGNVSPASAALAVNIDRTAPAAPTPDLQDASDSGASNTDNITNAANPVFTITGEAGATFTLARGGTTVGAANTASPITDTGAPEGAQSYTATQRDLAGNDSPASSALAVTIDRTVAAPAAPDLQAGSDSGISTSDNITNALTHVFDLTGVEANATATLLRGTNTVGTRTGNGAITDATTLGEGAFSYTATQTDVAGNVSTASPGLTITQDTIAPAAPGAPQLLNGVAAATTTSSSPRFESGVTGNAVNLLRNGVVVATSASGGVVTDPGPVAPGTYNYTTQAVDAAGNASGQSAPTSVTVDPNAGLPIASTADGYWLVATDGGIFSYGSAKFFGSTGGTKLNKPIVGMAGSPSKQGYWMVASDGGIFAFGDAKFFGSTGSLKLVKPILAMEPTPTGNGYWLIASDGGLFAFGDAQFFGSATNVAGNNPAIGMAATPTGKGYIIVLADGSVIPFGDAQKFGELKGTKLVSPITGVEMTPTGRGYWMFAADGGIFSFGDAGFFGSIGGKKLNQPVTGGAAQPDGKGYYMVATDGGIFAFGSATFQGSAASIPGHLPIVGMSRS